MEKNLKRQVDECVYNPVHELEKHVKNARKRPDPWAFAWALDNAEELVRGLKKLDKFRLAPVYKRRLAQALARWKHIVEGEEYELRKYGEGNSSHYVMRDDFKSHQQYLRLVEEEAKRMSVQDTDKNFGLPKGVTCSCCMCKELRKA